eukprot:Nitzschia sp. Nitz4//scaffold30_size153850//93671//103110//NITZ4_002785-RA/size153850-augustus-gene-0.62-mRNA-1//1//CDS//3329547285//6708//frame0
MAGETPFPHEPLPYTWDDTNPPPPNVLKLWEDVALGIDKSQTVVWKSAVESLDAVQKLLETSPVARTFAEKYMQPIISILVEQQPAKIGNLEKSCVEDSLALAVSIIALDLDIQLRRHGKSLLLEVLSLVFNKKKTYYRGVKSSWNNVVGRPEVRIKMIKKFRLSSGFARLEKYLLERIGTLLFPSLDTLHHVLSALPDIIQIKPAAAETPMPSDDQLTDVAKATMRYINSLSDDDLKKIPTEHLSTLQHDLHRVFDKAQGSRRTFEEFYVFWRALVLKLIKSPSLPLRLFGWQQMDELLDACMEDRPPPRYFDVSTAGTTFVNGRYHFIGATTPEGYAERGVDISYARRIPPDDSNGGGKKLTLFRCTMRSHQKWWFLSEADEEQPGTDRDIDYYQHKSQEHEETEPPPFGWVTCPSKGLDPPPQLKAVGLMVPEGAEFDTLEHQLAKWAIENGIIELVLGDSVHREIVSRSTALIKFLASMCQRESPAGVSENPYCLQKSHLQLAWKTCSKKIDAAVTAQVNQLLVSILPSCPSSLAIPLLKSVQDTLRQGRETGESLPEVVEFCITLASVNTSDPKAPSTINLKDEVRAEVLALLWSVLTHPEASSLKGYDTLKTYVTNELRVEPNGRAHRERFLSSCVEALTASAGVQKSASFDELQAVRMVKLTHFVLQSCPRAQAEQIVMRDGGALPNLVFSELSAYLERRKHTPRATPIVKKSPSVDTTTKPVVNPLSERLHILRYVYGVHESISMTIPQLLDLWRLCSFQSDREDVMVFVASASSTGHIGNTVSPSAAEPGVPQQANVVHPEDILTAAFPEDVCASVFLTIFCSERMSYQLLGENGYKSFQFLYNKLRFSAAHGAAATSAAIDMLWRISLGASDEAVATQAMKDLLAVYHTYGEKNGWLGLQSSDEMDTGTPDENFGRRIFDCLAKVNEGLTRNDAGAEVAAVRCMRILNAAIGRVGVAGSVTQSSLARLAALPPVASLEDIVSCLPHNMRGQGCYRRIGVMVKRTQNLQGPQPQQVVDRELRGTLRFSLDIHPLETLFSIKKKVALKCECPLASVKPISVTGRLSGNETTPSSLTVVPEDSVVDELGILQGAEMVFLVADRQTQQAAPMSAVRQSRAMNDLSGIFCGGWFADKLFVKLLEVLESLPMREGNDMMDDSSHIADAHRLVWDLLLAMPTNSEVASKVMHSSNLKAGDAMDIDARQADNWSKILDLKNFHHSVYVLLAIDAFLLPAVEVLSTLPEDQRIKLDTEMIAAASEFRHGFIQSGGFDAVVQFFSMAEEHLGMSQTMARMGNAVVLRILKCCLFGHERVLPLEPGVSLNSLDQDGARLLRSLSNAQGLLKSLVAMVVGDSGISTTTISDILKFLQLLFKSQDTVQSFVALGSMAEKFLVALLMWEGSSESIRLGSTHSAAAKVRKSTHDLILCTPLLADNALPWLIRALEEIKESSESTADYFDIVKRLLINDTHQFRKASTSELSELATAVCKTLASCSRPTTETAVLDSSSGVLRGCLTLLRAIVETAPGSVLVDGISILIHKLKARRWSETLEPPSNGMFSQVASQSKPSVDDLVLVDLLGVIFDSFLAPGGPSSTIAICCDKESRQRGFDVVGAAARSCSGGHGYVALVMRISGLITRAAPFLKHRWRQVPGGHDQPRNGRGSSKYSGLRNQGCTCYMNSLLQQLFMMPELRHSLCAAPLPSSVRSSGGVVSSKGAELVGKKVSMQWENGASYEAVVESFDRDSGMHTIRYSPISVAAVSGTGHRQVHPDDIARLPPLLAEEFILPEGRPGKETGSFEVSGPTDDSMVTSDDPTGAASSSEVSETEDEAASRHLMEEVQRTFIHLDEGSRGRCFDPRALVEACACLKLEFDVWQQNDASEFATKLLDRLETSLKRWAPSTFRYLDHTFGLKQTKQKICKECGLKSNREEKLLNVDCQIRGKSDIHEALGSMTEVEIMEGNNQVFCDRCKKNTDTILRTAISTLPNMLILSLKRFDLDYTTFETVKLNSRCAFGQTLNLKQYTLEGLEAAEQAQQEGSTDDMDTGTGSSELPDADYEYKLAGVLVHAGVAQGGHYYSFIKDRSPGTSPKWYRFDDEDVTPFDPSLIEVECFGGKVKKETKWPNGQVHTVESEQFANALMLFYEKVKPTSVPPRNDDDKPDAEIPENLAMSSGYDVFEPDVNRSNTTHRFQSFLFDAELQAFLKGLLGLCRMSGSETEDDRVVVSWRRSVVQMLLTFVFDVLLYSNERYALADWVRLLEEVLHTDKAVARAFLAKLSSKTKTVSGNWLRTFLAECPDAVARTAATRIFVAAVQSCLVLEDEQSKLKKWSMAWSDMIPKLGDAPVPFTLINDWKLPGEETSSIGSILSTVSMLIENSPRAHPSVSRELSLFVRNLVCIDAGGDTLRRAMVDCAIPARLICLITRDRSHPKLLAAFPGSSVSNEVAETQTLVESETSTQMMNLSGSNVMNPPEMSYNGVMDFLPLLEALGVLLGIRGVIHSPIVVEVDETSVRGRQRSFLSDRATEALRQLFEEWCAGPIGMTQREVEGYMQKCGAESLSLPSHNILDMMTTHPAPGTGENGNYLTWDGFLSYYQDMSQSLDLRVRQDLYNHGFRPDLTRRPIEVRVLEGKQGHEHTLTTVESIAMDVVSMLSNVKPTLGEFGDLGVSSFEFFSAGYSASETLSEHILSATGYEKHHNELIVETLRAVYHAPTGWAGNERLSAAVMVLRVLCSIPDSFQRNRIHMIMEYSDERVAAPSAGSIGLLSAPRALMGGGQRYTTEVRYAHDRYVGVLKVLLDLQGVSLWMAENRHLWNWMEADLLESHHANAGPTRVRDFAGRREGAAPGVPTEHHQISDEEGPGIIDSDLDDEDSRGEDMETYGNEPTHVIVEGAGNLAVNGLYKRHGTFQNAARFSRDGEYQGKKSLFSLFQCHVSNNTRHWYISFVPADGPPGTNSDTDFYTSPVSESCMELPPLSGWITSTEGANPPPTLLFKDSGGRPQRGWTHNNGRSSPNGGRSSF